MAKAGRGADQFPLRLPEGMRDRIATAAEKHGRSMNAEIVSVLELHFPEPFSFEKRVSDLLVLARGLKAIPNTPSVDALIEELEKTIEEIAHGRAPELGEEARSKIYDALHEWRSHKNGEYSSRIYRWMDEAGEPHPTYDKDGNEIEGGNG